MLKLAGIAILVLTSFFLSKDVIASSDYRRQVDSLFRMANQLKNDTSGTQAFENLFNASLLSLKTNYYDGFDRCIMKRKWAIAHVKQLRIFLNNNPSIFSQGDELTKGLYTYYQSLASYNPNDDSLEYQRLLDAENFFTSIDNKPALQIIYYEMAISFYNVKDHSKANDYFRKSLAECSGCLFQVGINTMLYMGDGFEEVKNHDSARIMYNKILRTLPDTGFYKFRAAALAGTSNTYLFEEKYDDALRFMDSATNLARQHHDSVNIMFGNSGQAAILLEMKNYKEALPYLQLCLPYYQRVHTTRYDLLEGLYDNLYVAYDGLKDYKNALYYSQLSDAMSDSVKLYDNQQKLADIAAKYENDKKQQQLNAKDVQLQQERKLNYAIGIGLLLFLLSTIFIYRSYLLKRNANKKLAEKNVLIEKEKRRAEEGEKFKQQFLANMSHEIRTPMNAIIGLTDLLQNEPQSTKGIKYLDVVRNSAGNLLVIINDILDLAKIEAGKIKFEKIPFNLHEQIRLLDETLGNKAREKKLQFITAIDQNIPPYLKGDPSRLMQILVNLVGNGIKFTERGMVKLEVRSKRVDESEVSEPSFGFWLLTFDISDTGIGIPKEKQAEIFESFTQAKSSDSRRYGGTGLGLTITKNLVELQDGTIALQSEEGKGSVFTFSLPFETVSTQEIEQLQSQVLKTRFIRNKKMWHVIVAEDNEYNELVITESLKHVIEKIQIEMAHTGKEVIDKLRMIPCDLILMDLQMPEMDGFETTQFIRNNFPEPAKSLPVIALTASVAENDLSKCYAAGMNGFLSKPFRQNDLVNELMRVLDA